MVHVHGGQYECTISNLGIHVCLDCVSPRSLNQEVQEEEGVALEQSKMRMDTSVVKTSSTCMNQLAPSTSVGQSSSIESAVSSESSEQQVQGKES